ncbi:MAG TPA: glycosyltransferase family 2 protein [Candidatus Pacearchaeota archaeon]|nr:glycosyltransferase family 2 protein [Candidatus Pacearchaeota archaeon]HOL90199.1 glycosyltransferase family 2 protein [Candidatus Pacearchaeota archaeon]HOW12742.1 glycosyltransferase family 2 protein [Candidatus Pacearchaeota archaeon]
MKVAAIVPALNEEKNIGRVLKVLIESKDLNEVIVVDDGSTDNTSGISREMGAKVIRLEKIGGSGKANAMKEGIKNTDADIIVFFDADLTGLTNKHVSDLIKPVIEDRAVMAVGLRERYLGIGNFLVKIDPLLAIAGERAMKRFVFENIPEEFLKGFTVETALNFYCKINNLPVAYIFLKGLNMVVKEKKWGFWKGFRNRVKMINEIIKIRFLILFNKDKFKNV